MSFLQDAIRDVNLLEDIESNNGIVAYFSSNKAYSGFDAEISDEIGLHCGTLEQARSFESRKFLYKILLDKNTKFVKYDDQFNDWSSLAAAKNIGGDILHNKAEEVARNSTNKRKDLSTLYRNFILDHGYDAVVYENEIEGEGDSYIILNPSVINNVEELEVNESLSSKKLNESWIQDIKETTDYLWTWYKEGMVSDVARDIYNDAVDKVADEYPERSRAFYEVVREVFSDNLDKYYEELKASVAELLEKGYADNNEKINRLIDDRIKRLENE